MKDLRAIRGGRIVREMIAQGEHETQDFKFAVSDASKIARSLSAFANNHGGRLLIGVKDNGNIAGVRSEEDACVVELAAERYCRPAQKIDFKAYNVDGTACVIVAEIEASADRPIYASEPDGSWRAYYRVADENIVAPPLMVRAWEMQASGLGSAFSLDGITTAVLAYISERVDVADSRELALALHVSQAAADEAVARLMPMELIEFVFVSPGFRIKAVHRQ